MNLRLRSIESLEEALSMAAVLGGALVDSYPGVLEGASREALGREFLAAQFADSQTLLLVAEGERPLAVAATAPLADPVTGERSPLLVALWVDPSIRRRGVARELVGELQRLLRRRECGALLARVPSGDDALLGMAERWGLVRDVEVVRAS